jgi:hypothetical protein
MSQQDRNAMLAMLVNSSTVPVAISGRFIPLCLKLTSKTVTPIRFVPPKESYPLSLRLKSKEQLKWWELRKLDESNMNILTISDTITVKDLPLGLPALTGFSRVCSLPLSPCPLPPST